MAEALAVASGVAGLLSLGIQVTQGLVQFYTTNKDRDSTAAKTLERLQSLLHLLEQVKETVNRYRERGEQRIVDDLLESVDRCAHSIDELRSEYNKLIQSSSDNTKSKLNAIGLRALYPFHKDTLDKLDVEISKIQDIITLTLSTLGLRSQEALHDGLLDLQSRVELVRSDLISEKVRNWLNAPDTTSDHNAANEKRHPHTGEWLINGQIFQNWLTEDSSFLWLSGFAGCGKSVLCSTVIEHLLLRKQIRKGIGVGFYYFNFREEQKGDDVSMLRVLLLQLASQSPDGPAILERFYDQHPTGVPGRYDLIKHLRYMISKFSQVYILIDAVDESPRSRKRRGVMRSIREIRTQFSKNLHVLCTSRKERDIEDFINDMKCPKIDLRNAQVDEDIRDFIRGRLNSDEELRYWRKHHSLIEQALVERAGGGFRWVDCQFEALIACPRSLDSLKTCLHSLPDDLDATYERMLCSIPETSVEQARRMLMLLCFSGRPLMVAEVMEGIAVSLTHPTGVKSTSQLDDWQSLLDICPGLVEFHPNPFDCATEDVPFMVTARIAHFSVQEYLVLKRIKSQKAAHFALTEGGAHAEIAQICYTYLKEPNLSEGTLSILTLEENPLAQYSAEFWIHHYQRANDATMQLQMQVLDVFQSQPDVFFSWMRIHDFERSYTTPNLKRRKRDIPSPVYYLSLLGLDKVLLKLLQGLDDPRTACMKRTNGGILGDPLQAASFSGHAQIVQILLDHGADVNALTVVGIYGTALQAASGQGHEEVVKLLIDRGANVHTISGSYGDALQAASAGGHIGVVKILLDKGADVNSELTEFDGNALAAASAHGREEVVYYLLQRGAIVNAQHIRPEAPSRTALQAASAGGYEKTVEALLASKADVNIQGGYFGNALLAASQNGHAKIVRRLLAAGARVNEQGGWCGNALLAACLHGDEETVRILLGEDADANASHKDYGSPLQVASMQGCEAIVKMLLGRKAEVDFKGRTDTALQMASGGGFTNIVLMLLEHGANVNIRGRDGTALQAAARMGRKEIIPILLKHGANTSDLEG